MSHSQSVLLLMTLLYLEHEPEQMPLKDNSHSKCENAILFSDYPVTLQTCQGHQNLYEQIKPKVSKTGHHADAHATGLKSVHQVLKCVRNTNRPTVVCFKKH